MTELAIGISGINAIDNPGPGVGVARSLKEDSGLSIKTIGLSYDALEPGMYMDWLIDKAFICHTRRVSRMGIWSGFIIFRQAVVWIW